MQKLSRERKREKAGWRGGEADGQRETDTGEQGDRGTVGGGGAGRGGGGCRDTTERNTHTHTQKQTETEPSLRVGRWREEGESAGR
eukprot:2183181-Rhodomonas_salina.1